MQVSSAWSPEPSQTIINQVTQAPTLVLRLKNRQQAIENRQMELAQKAHNQMSRLQECFSNVISQPHSANVALENKTIMLIVSQTENTLSLHNEDHEQVLDEEQVEQFFECEENEAEVRDLVEEAKTNQALTELAELADGEQSDLTFFQTLSSHLSTIMHREGTALLTTAGAAGLAVTTAPFTIPLTVGALLATAASVTLGVAAANEVKKMIGRQINHAGAAEPLVVIQHVLDNMQKRNQQAAATIEAAIDHQSKIQEELNKAQSVISGLQEQLVTAEGEVHTILEEMITAHTEQQTNLQEQYDAFENAISHLKKSITITHGQEEAFKKILDRELTRNLQPEELEQVVAEIKKDIEKVQSMAHESGQEQELAMTAMMQAMNKSHSIRHYTHRKIPVVLGKLMAVEKDLQQANTQAADARLQLKQAIQNNEAAIKNANELKTLNQQDKNELEVAQDNLEALKQQEFFGNASTTWGTMTAGVISAVGAVAITTNPVGLVVGVGVGTFLLGSTAVRSVHYARKFMRAWQQPGREHAIEVLQRKLEQQRTADDCPVSIEASYGYSVGNWVGTGGLKTTWNASADIANWVAGQQVAEHWKSTRYGEVSCKIGDITIPLEFDKQDAMAAKYGAISVSDQEKKLSKIFTQALEERSLSPQAILDCLDQLSSVTIGEETIVMITSQSPALQNLRAQCYKMLKEQEAAPFKKSL